MTVRSILVRTQLTALLLVACCPLGALADQAAGPLNRPFAHLHLRGSQVAPLLGCPAQGLVLLSSGSDGLGPVPLQVDRRNARDELLYPQQPGYPRPAQPLTTYDELVFMAADAGARPDSEILPARSVLIEAVDSLNNAEGWFCLACDPSGDLGRSDRDYVNYDPETTLIVGQTYRVGSSTENMALTQELSMGSPGGVDFLDRIKLRARVEVLGLFTIERIEDDILGRRLGYIDGPVRVVRKNAYSLRMFWSVRSPQIVREAAAYGNSAEFPNDLNVPFDLDLLFSDVDIYTWLDLAPELGVARVYSNRQTPELVVDGAMTDAELRIEPRVPWWICLHQERNGFLLVTRLSEPMLNMPYNVRFHYLDDDSAIDPPEDAPGQRGGFGFDIENVQGFTKGRYEFGAVFYFTDDYRRGWEQLVLVDDQSPLELRVIKVD
ncbi:MAG: hypothetical protein P9M14_02485 [Candidatus Alcyoniella australis]|nr:hypothetical protein [Candidatus Alcyoniella australis]